jgi:lipopolysaccharide transport system ATP-binding protein
VRNLGKRYKLGEKRAGYSTLRDLISGKFRRRDQAATSDSEKDQIAEFWALRDVSFDVKPGETIGVIGRNGAGKSTLLKILSRITEPSTGSADIYGRVGSLLEVGTGFHFELPGRENIYLSGAILGMKRDEIKQQFDEIVAFAEIENFLETPVKHYSSGMLMRLAFAVSAHLQPEILLIDEVLAVGDAAFQRKCLGKMNDVARQGRTVLFVSHNMSAILELCRRAILIDRGRLAFDGAAAQCVEAYFKYNSLNNGNAETSKNQRRLPFEIGALTVEGAHSAAVKSGSEFSVKLRLSGRKVKNPAIYFIIENVAGQTIVHKRIKSKELCVDTIDGDYLLKIDLPALWLSPGVYSIYCKFIAPATDWSGSARSEALMLEVRGELEATGKSILNPEVLWRIEKEERATVANSSKIITGLF